MSNCPRTRSITGMAFLLCASAAVFIPLKAEAALDAYAVIIGETQGQIQGDVTIDPHAGSILIKAFGSSVSADYDAATGLPGSGKQHRPVRLLKNVNKSSPQLLAAFSNNERLVSVTLKFFRPSHSGAEQHHVTIVLENAYIVSILPAHSSQAGDDQTIPFRETISLTYESMTVTDVATGFSTEIPW